MRKNSSSFTFTLALLDFVPVFMFSVSIMLVALRFKKWLFILGAVLSFIAGLSKACWKMIKALTGKDIEILSDYFMPVMMSGFIIMLISVIISFKHISIIKMLGRCLHYPVNILIILAVASLIFMFNYRKKYFKRDDYHSNLIAEIANTFFQLMLMLIIINF